MGGEPLLKAANFDVGVRLLPLLRQEIVVDRLELNEPVFSLRVDTDGRRTWDIAGVDLPVRFTRGFRLRAVSGSDRQSCRRRAGRGRRAVDRRHPHLDGAVRYSDERNGAWGRFDGLNAEFALAAMDQPLQAAGAWSPKAKRSSSRAR